MRDEAKRICDAHRSLRRAARWLRTCPEFEVSDAFASVMSAAEHSFALEHALMDSVCFPATRCHLEQHARVLRALHCLYPAVIGGATSSGRRVGGQLLIQWFRLHNETLDAAVFLWAGCCGKRSDELQRHASHFEIPYGAEAVGSANAFGNSTHN